MIRALTRMGYGGDAIIIAPGLAGGIDPRVTLFPRDVERPFIFAWAVQERDGKPVLAVDLHWMTPRPGAA